MDGNGLQYEFGFFWCALLMDILGKLCSGLVSVGQEVWKRKKNGRDC